MPPYKKDLALPFKDSHAFIIGIDDYQHLSPLSTAVNDAEGLARQLEEEHGYIVHGPLLNSTRAELEAWLEKTMSAVVGADDRVMIYFAGHGIALDSERGPRGYLVPADARPGDTDSLLSMESLHRAIAGLPCRHGLLILDCCFSGAFRWATGFRDLVVDLPNVIYEERFWQYTRDPAWQVITSSGSDQKAADSLVDFSLGNRCEEQSGHSPFALALFDGLSGEADLVPQDGGDGVITASELYAYLRDRVEDETTEHEKRQTPSFFNLARHDKGQYIFLHPRHRLNLPPTPNRNPYLGLKAFEEKDAALFFGRTEAANALEQVVKSRPLTVITGASGTGKSSLVKAGLLPRLRTEGWYILPPVCPGETPLQSLNARQVEEVLCREEQAVLVVDQYEELATKCIRPEDRWAFEYQLAEWLKKYEGFRLAITLRSDMEPRFKHSPLSGLWEEGRYEVPSLNTEELKEAILRPAEQEVLFFEPESLVDRLEEEVSHAPDMLPMLSLTLSELYSAYLKSGRLDRSFAEEDYFNMGGVAGVLYRQANEVYDNFDNLHRRSMRNLLLRMASFEEEDEVASRRIYEEELVFTDEEETRRMQAVVDKMAEARIIFKDIDARQRVYIEFVHETMMGKWERLCEWIRASGEEKLILHHKLTVAAAGFQKFSGARQASGIAMPSFSPKKRFARIKGLFGDNSRLLWANDPYLPVFINSLEVPGHGFNHLEEAFIRRSEKARRGKRQASFASVTIIVTLLFASSALAVMYHKQATMATAGLEAALQKIEMMRVEVELARLLYGQPGKANGAIVDVKMQSLPYAGLEQEKGASDFCINDKKLPTAEGASNTGYSFNASFP